MFIDSLNNIQSNFNMLDFYPFFIDDPNTIEVIQEVDLKYRLDSRYSLNLDIQSPFHEDLGKFFKRLKFSYFKKFSFFQRGESNNIHPNSNTSQINSNSPTDADIYLRAFCHYICYLSTEKKSFLTSKYLQFLSEFGKYSTHEIIMKIEHIAFKLLTNSFSVKEENEGYHSEKFNEEIRMIGVDTYSFYEEEKLKIFEFFLKIVFIILFHKDTKVAIFQSDKEEIKNVLKNSFFEIPDNLTRPNCIF